MEIKTDTSLFIPSRNESPVGTPSVRKACSAALPGDGAVSDPPSGGKGVPQAAREPADVLPIRERELNLQVDSELKMIVASVVDKDTGNVIRQIPSNESIASARQIKEQLDRMIHDRGGTLVNKEA